MARLPQVVAFFHAGQFYFLSSDLAEYVGRTLTPERRDALRDGRRRTENADVGSFVFSSPYPVKFVDMTRRRRALEREGPSRRRFGCG